MNIFQLQVDMDATLAANLLLAATIAVFVLLTLIAFLLTDGKPIFVEPLKIRMKERFGESSIHKIILNKLKIRRRRSSDEYDEDDGPL